jgi:hydrogenase nickel incorporation protein HypA/HybF
MHEQSLVKALLRQVEAVAVPHSGSRVISIRVRIGEFSGVEAELLASAYEDLVQHTTFCGATLDVERVTLEAVCQQCGHRFRVEQFNFQCAKCGSIRLTLQGGEELLLDSVVMEEAEL